MTSEMLARMSEWFVRCPTHGRVVGTMRGLSSAGRRVAMCPTCLDGGNRTLLRAVWVHWTDAGEGKRTKCGARCLSAKREDCECECAGANHGANRH